MRAELIYLIAYSYLIYLIPILIVGLPSVFFTYKRMHWYKTDFLILLLPYLAWFTSTSLLRAESKSLSNVFAEPFFLGVILALVLLLRTFLAKTFNFKKIIVLIIGLSLFAFMFGALFPLLPE